MWEEWEETKREEREEQEYASEHFPDEPTLWCERCKVGVCEDH